MSYPELLDGGTIQLSHDMIDMLVAAVELTELHKSLSDADPIKSVYMDMVAKLNDKINEEMHRNGLEDLFEVRNRLELSIRSIIRARKQAYAALQNVIEAKI